MHLTSVDLSANCFDVRAMDSILQFIRSAPRLKEEKLSGNQLLPRRKSWNIIFYAFILDYIYCTLFRNVLLYCIYITYYDTTIFHGHIWSSLCDAMPVPLSKCRAPPWLPCTAPQKLSDRRRRRFC